MPKIDLSTSALKLWNNFTSAEQAEWSKFFDLADFTPAALASFSNYNHNYHYHLTNTDLTRMVFCLVVEILRYNKFNNMKRVFVANSGGLDSAVICALLARAKKLAAVSGEELEVFSYGLPIESNPDHGARAAAVAERFGLEHVVIENLDATYLELKNILLPLSKKLNFNEEELRRGLGNTKARLRMIVNFFSTAKVGGYVISTDNLSELYMAFWTLMGDVGAYGPIQNILKGLEEPALAYVLGVPEVVLAAKPTDGLNVHTSLDSDEGGDTDAFRGIYYPHLDAIICLAVRSGLRLDKVDFVSVPGNLIQSPAASQENVDSLVRQMFSPASVWKRTKGSIGTAPTREDLGLPPLSQVVNQL